MKLAWDDPGTDVSGYAVTIDGARTDYGLSPLAADGTCGCTIPLPFSGGTHSIVVSAYNAYGEAAAQPLNVAPSANAGGPYSGTAGTAVTVDGSGSNNPAGNIVQWAWNWGDGTTSVVTTAITSHTYADGGTYTIGLTVTDDGGATASASASASISAPPPPPPPPAATTVVLWSANVPDADLHGNFVRTFDSSAAGGNSVGTPDRAAAKIATALATPASYVEMSFTANAGVAYHLWVRMRAQGDSMANDSVHVQFSDSVDASGAEVMRIGSTDSAQVVLQDGPTGAAPHGWGWADNGWGAPGVNVWFASTGTHTLRIQQREDGASVDQVVLSPDTYATQAPGPRKDDATILQFTDGTPPSSSSGEETTVLWTAHAAATDIHGNWQLAADAAAASGTAVWNPDAGAPKVTPAQAFPTNYFEMTFPATAGVPYHIWLRMRAQGDAYSNDSVHVQFSDSVTATGSPTMQIGSTSSAEIVLQDGSSAPAPSGWGWADNGWGTRGVDVYFATTGTHTIRIQQREDGAFVDQIVISGDTYLTTAPGGRSNDATILPERSGS